MKLESKDKVWKYICVAVHRCCPRNPPCRDESIVQESLRKGSMGDGASKALAESPLPRESRADIMLCPNLGPSEEKALEKYLQPRSSLGNPVRMELAPSLALNIARQRSTT